MIRRILTAIVLLTALTAAPVLAQDGRQGRSRGSDRGGGDRGAARIYDGGGRSAGRSAAPRGRDSGRSYEMSVQRRSQNAPRQYAPPPRYDAGRASRQVAQPRAGSTGRYGVPRSEAYRTYGNRSDGTRSYGSRGYVVPRHPRPVYDRRFGSRYVAPRYAPPPRYVRRGYPGYSGYGRVHVAPRYVRPHVVTILPYRPYRYRPSLSIGVFYGAGGVYPYGYTPRRYYDPLPGVPYGGVRIIDAPREAQVFADGYYVGIVDDFDGLFQHLNLEAGEHRIEIHAPGYEPLAFDVMVQPERTITLRADPY